jgi:AbiV family abortive infection protein
MSMTPQELLHGGAYALEQCGLLLRDANILYRNRSYASSIVLTAFAREELGRSKILFDLRRRALGGKIVTIAQVRKACEDHLAKQRAGMLSLTMMADRESGLGKLMRARWEHHPQSPEWQKANVELERINDSKRKRLPSDRHEKRTLALYVELLSTGQWNRPAATSADAAHTFLQDAVNDYAGRYDQGYITAADSMVKHIDPELYSALEQWSERPELPPVELIEPPWNVAHALAGVATVVP